VVAVVFEQVQDKLTALVVLVLSLFVTLTPLQPLLQPQAHQQLQLLVATVFINGLHLVQ
jgi:hypothetical protein